MTLTTTATSRSLRDRRGSRTQSVRAVARVEALRMVRHPAFLLGALASVLQITVRPGTEDWAGQGHYLSSTAWTFAWVGMMLAAAKAAGRERFPSDPDPFPATPATPADRVLGTALGLIGPVLVAAAFVAFVAVMNARAGGFTLGEGAYMKDIKPSAFDWAQPALLVALAGVVGIAVTQLRRARLAAVIVVVLATFFGGTTIWAFQAHPVRVLHPFMYPTYEERLPDSFSPAGWEVGDAPLLPPDEYADHWRAIRFDTPALGWHLLYVAGLVLIGVWVAARLADGGERTAPIRWLLLAGLPLLIAGGVAQILTAGTNG